MTSKFTVVRVEVVEINEVVEAAEVHQVLVMIERTSLEELVEVVSFDSDPGRLIVNTLNLHKSFKEPKSI